MSPLSSTTASTFKDLTGTDLTELTCQSKKSQGAVEQLKTGAETHAPK